MFRNKKNKLIDNTRDEYGNIKVIENKNERYLLFDTQAKQSAISTRYPYFSTLKYQHIMQLVAFFDIRLTNLLFIGLGGGCMPKFFNQSYPRAKIKTLELRKDVEIYARKYFYFESSANSTVEIIDAADWIKKEHKKKYDVIFLDSYKNEGIPTKINSIEYYKQCYQLLSDQGILVINFWLSYVIEEKEKINKLKYLFNNKFLISDVHGCDNKIFFMFKSSYNFINFKTIDKYKIEKIESYYNVPYNMYLRQLREKNSI